MHTLRTRALAAGVSLCAFLAVFVAPAPAVALPADTSQTFADIGSVQTWTVPEGVTEVYVSLAGAQGGAADNRGAGAQLTGTLSVTPGETLNILVGSQGQNGVRFVRGGGGGGGSFIYTTADQAGILAAAGGGGGAGSDRGGLAASTTTTGTAGGNGGGAGGTDGSGGVEGPAAGGGGGGGLTGDGVDGNRGGQSVASGAAGGPGSNVRFVGTRGTGGFGGGGGTGSTGGGGGGGYSGGGGGRFADGHGGGGGGGGSYFAGSLTGAVADNLGRGFVTISYPSVLTSVTPAAAAVGASVTIEGSGLAGATVTIGGVSAAVTSSSDGRLVATVPAVSPLPAGAQTIEVATADGATLPAVGSFTYVPTPTVTTVAPSSVEQGSSSTVMLTGTHLGNATAVYFGAAEATTFTVVSDTAIAATVPTNLRVGAEHTTVVTPGATSAETVADVLTITMAPITLAPDSLSAALVGQSYSAAVTAAGGTAPYVYSVISGTLPAGISLDAAGSLAGVPTEDGTFPLTIEATDHYGSTMSADYSLEVAAPVPTVTTVGPASGTTSGGTSVTITGSGFTGTTGVSFGGVDARSYTVTSDTSITAVTPASSAGTVNVIVATQGGVSATTAQSRFTYAEPTVVPARVTPSEAALARTGSEGATHVSLAAGLFLAGLIAGGFALFRRRRDETM